CTSGARFSVRPWVLTHGNNNEKRSPMNRRNFLTGVSGTLVASPWLRSQAAPTGIDLKSSVVVLPTNATAREKNAANVLIEEAEKRSQLRWKIQPAGGRITGTAIYAGTRTSARGFRSRISSATKSAARLSADGYAIQTGKDADGDWIAVIGADERGLLFGIGRLLYAAEFGRQSAQVDRRRLAVTTSPKRRLRGHQLGYRPKTNAYDAWDVATWDQYIRDLAMFGTNAIELMPPRTDDAADSPHYPLPPEQMMVEMSRICDRYGLDVWIWYPAMDPDYADAPTVERALKEWAHIFQSLPRIDAIFVPRGDPGHTE